MSQKCQSRGCLNQARVAIATKRPNRERMYSTIDYDDRTAPKTFSRYCKKCAIDIMTGIIRSVVDDDEMFEE